MKTLKKNTILLSLMPGIFLLSNSCGDKGPEVSCESALTEISLAKDSYSANPTVSNCQKVVKAYDNYIDNSECDDRESYINLRDAFQKKNCP